MGLIIEKYAFISAQWDIDKNLLHLCAYIYINVYNTNVHILLKIYTYRPISYTSLMHRAVIYLTDRLM